MNQKQVFALPLAVQEGNSGENFEGQPAQTKLDIARS